MDFEEVKHLLPSKPLPAINYDSDDKDTIYLPPQARRGIQTVAVRANNPVVPLSGPAATARTRANKKRKEHEAGIGSVSISSKSHYGDKSLGNYYSVNRNQYDVETQIN